MEVSSRTARQLYEALQAAKTPRFGFGTMPAIVNVDLQKAYTRPAEFGTAYETDPRQMEHVARLAALARAKRLPVIWTFVAYRASGDESGVWGRRGDGPDALRNIRPGSGRAALDERLGVDPERDVVINKAMASAFHETRLGSLLTLHRIDTIIVTGGSTSGCVRATVVDGVSRGFHVIVPEDCVADRHESPHFASLYDMHLKYADVLPVTEVMAHLEALPGSSTVL
jgi:nicotinamidase-related amidase